MNQLSQAYPGYILVQTKGRARGVSSVDAESLPFATGDFKFTSDGESEERIVHRWGTDNTLQFSFPAPGEEARKVAQIAAHCYVSPRIIRDLAEALGVKLEDSSPG